MINSELFDDYLSRINRLGNGRGSSACIANADAAILCSNPSSLLIPELTSIETARQLVQSLLTETNSSRRTQEECIVKRGKNPLCLLILVLGTLPTHTGRCVQNERRSFVGRDIRLSESWLLLGIEFADADEMPLFNVEQATKPVDAADWLLNLIILAGRSVIANWEMSRALRHSISDLPGRIEFDAVVSQLAKRYQQTSQPLGLLFINPDNFEQINHRFGRDRGDGAVRDLATLLRSLLRESDLLFHYSGAIFAILLPGTDSAGAKSIAEKIRQKIAAGAFVNQAVKLSVSVGGSSSDPASMPLLGPTELVRRADSALNIAKLAGGARTVFWTEGRRPQLAGALGEGSAIFTADPVRDYRNMSLLWELISAVAAEHETQLIGRELTGRVAKSFKARSVALFYAKSGSKVGAVSKQSAGTRMQLISASEWQPDTEVVSAIHVEPDEEPIDSLIQKMVQEEQPAFNKLSAQISQCSVPLMVRGVLIGCLYVDNGNSHEMDERDLAFLAALVGQIAVTLDRADLLGKWMEKKEVESKKLRFEVSELRHAVRENKLVYQSAEMQQVMRTVQKVASTNATVLITGESGTGKEMLGHAVHDLSARFDKPFVTVDCGAISPNLIEAELFGRVKGAYTGADSTTKGYIRQAEGGTLFLDEIGELPLGVQTRLLRFVQEKTVSSVGASTSEQVDVRIIAATNRDLLEEVRIGGFRSDLFYRLQVMTLTPPPLRNHTADILPIAYHFLEKFCLQYQKRGLYLSADAKSALESYLWPGNVRELQHTLMRAVLMTDSEMIGVDELNLQHASPSPNESTGLHWQLPKAPADSEKLSQGSLWGSLEEVLADVVEIEVENLAPLGRWLTQEFLLAANQLAFGVIRDAAALLGQAESTYRRQLGKAQRLSQLEPGPKNEQWQQVEKIVVLLIKNRRQDQVDEIGTNIIHQGRAVLLRVVDRATGKYQSRGAALMDVSTPTYKSWLGV